jgi:tyrosine-protein kinase Etk/Wzc
MPYIEVGPRRYFEASPEVLATMPAPVSPPVEAPTSVVRPHNVLLRALPPAVVPPAAPRIAPELVAYHSPGEYASERYHDLLAGLLEAGQARAGMPCRALLLTAGRSGIGTTTVLLNLAITAARQDHRVVVLDANLRRAAVADRLGLPPSPGLTEVLAGEMSLVEALRPTAQPNLVILAAGAPTVLLADEASLRMLVGQLTREQDLVLIDGPRIEQPLPVVGRTWDSRALALLASLCQAMYLVVPATEADSKETTDLAALLTARALPLAGCIVAG